MFFPTPKQLQNQEIPRYDCERLLAEWSLDIAEAMSRGDREIVFDLGSPVFYHYTLRTLQGESAEGAYSFEDVINIIQQRLVASGWTWNATRSVNPVVGDTLTIRWFPSEPSGDESL